MAGIIQQSMPQPGQQAGNPQVVERIMAAVTRILHDPSTSQQIIGMLKQGDPAQAVVQVFTLIMRELATQSKGTLPKDIIPAVVPQIMKAIIELAQAAGLPPIDPKAVIAAAQQAMQQQGAPQGQPQAQAPVAQPAGA